MTLFREVGDKRNIANALTASAEVARDQGQAGEAAALLSEALMLCSEIGDRGWTSAHCMVVERSSSTGTASVRAIDSVVRNSW